MSDQFHNPSEDPRLTAYLFDEMETEERAAFEEELASSVPLQAALSQLRNVSNSLGRAFESEMISGDADASVAPRPKTSHRKLSSRARAGRISRLRQDIPKMNSSGKSRYAAFAAAAAAAVVLAGLVTIQSVISFSGSRGSDVAYVPLSTTKKGDYNEAVPLAKAIADEIAVETAAYVAEVDLVSSEVAAGLADSIDSRSVEESRFASTSPSSNRYAINPPKPEIVLESNFAESSVRQVDDARLQPKVFLKNDRSTVAQVDFQSAGDFGLARIPLHVETNSLGDLSRQMAASGELDLSEVTVSGLVNAFDYTNSEALRREEENPFLIDLEVAQTPWNRVHYLVRLTLESRDLRESESLEIDRSVYLAEDVRLKVKFNAEQVAAYRLIGYEPEVVSSEEIFSQPGESVRYGHQLTVLYEVIPVGSPVPRQSWDEEDGFEVATSMIQSGSRGMELLWTQIDFTIPKSEEQLTLTRGLTMPAEVPSWHGASRAFQWAAAVASFGMEILEDPLLTGANWELIEALARSGAGERTEEDYLKFISMIEKARAND